MADQENHAGRNDNIDRMTTSAPERRAPKMTSESDGDKDPAVAPTPVPKSRRV